MDVHPPHGAVHSVKEFMVHMLAITLGLLIALGLESAVEWMHHRHLVREARENIAQEMRENRVNLEKELAALPGEEKQLEAVTAVMTDAEQGRQPSQDLTHMRWLMVRLGESAWETSASTGATAYMPYKVAKQYSRAYELQTMFNQVMDKYIMARAEMFASLSRMSERQKASTEEYERDIRNVRQEAVFGQFLREIGGQLDSAYGELGKE